jgi:hypothetical protein
MTKIEKRAFHLLCLAVLLMALISCRSGERNSLTGLKSIGKIVPKSSSEIEASPFGIQAGTLIDSLVAKAAEIGVKWTRLGVSWPGIESEKGVYDWTETDKAFDIALKNGITPFVCISGGNKLYSKLTTYDNPVEREIYGYKPEPPIKDPVAMKAYLNFVTALVERYKDKIDYWEVWNEPNHRNYWGSEPNGKEYGKLVVETALILKEMDPGCKIIAGATAKIDTLFTDDFLSVGAFKLIDIISFHNYGPVPEERAYLAVDLWKVINKYNPKLEVWQGECGYPSHSSTRDYRGRAPWGLNIQAKWLLRQSFTDIFYCRATLSNYFKLAHTEGKGEKPVRSNLKPIDLIFGYPERGGSRVKTIGVNEKCLLTNPELNKKPGYFAYQNLCAIWRPDYKATPVQYSVKVTDQGIFYGIGEEDDAFPSVPLLATFRDKSDYWLMAWWLPWNMQEYIPRMAKIDIIVSGVKFTDPVMIDLLTGEVLEFDSWKQDNGKVFINGAPLADYPLLMAERSSLKFQ